MILNIHPNIVLLINNNLATIYSLTSSDDYTTETITPDNLPQYRHPSFNGNQNHLPTRPAQKSQGTKTPKAPINPQYFSRIARALQNAPQIIVLSRGTGKSNAANHLIKHLQTHHPNIIPRIIANQTINNPTPNQIIAAARDAFRRRQSRQTPTHHLEEVIL